MNWTREQRLVFQNYLQRIIEKPTRMEAQHVVKENGFWWCGEWHMIELLKYMINGHEYMGDPPPNRLKDNLLWSKDAIVEEGTAIFSMFKTPDAIVQYLANWREHGYVEHT